MGKSHFQTGRGMAFVLDSSDGLRGWRSHSSKGIAGPRHWDGKARDFYKS